MTMRPEDAVAHLTPSVWATVNRQLGAKALGELAHEMLLRPTLLAQKGGWGEYEVKTDSGAAAYRFRAQVLSLDHWWVDADSIVRTESGEQTPPDVMQLVVELRAQLGIPAERMGDYLSDLASTLNGAAFRSARPGLSAEGLTRADFQQVESAMSEGHPIFLANGGRVGFSAADHARYAPEAAVPVALHWLAAKRSRVELACVKDLTYEHLLEEELGASGRDAFGRQLWDRGLNPAQYVFLPVHPWQWENRLAQLFAPDLETQELVHLGPGRDSYLAQQSIRTFFNVTHPRKRYVKTALSILNMGFTRGLSAVIAQRAVAVNDWVNDLVNDDPFLRANGFSLLREVAFIGYRHRYYEAASQKRSDAYKEMLAACWRENPTVRLRPGERLMTMAALLHVDRAGGAVLPALIRSSGLETDAWVERYLQAYLTPLVHCFYAHNLTFTPHCENTQLVLEGNAPSRVILKDLAEDIGVLNPEQPLPERVRHLALRVPESVMTLTVFTDVFDCVFRFVAQLLQQHAGYPEQRFWQRVGECIRAYQAQQPVLAAKFQRYDLFAPTFTRNCLNRLQLRNNQEMVDLNAAEPVDSLQFVGTLDNPIRRETHEHR